MSRKDHFCHFLTECALPACKWPGIPTLRRFVTLGKEDSQREDGGKTGRTGRDKAPGALIPGIPEESGESEEFCLFVTFHAFRTLFATFVTLLGVLRAFSAELHIYSRIFRLAGPYQAGLNLTFLTELRNPESTLFSGRNNPYSHPGPILGSTRHLGFPF